MNVLTTALTCTHPNDITIGRPKWREISKPLEAGLMGRNKFAYHLYSDTYKGAPKRNIHSFSSSVRVLLEVVHNNNKIDLFVIFSSNKRLRLQHERYKIPPLKGLLISFRHLHQCSKTIHSENLACCWCYTAGHIELHTMASMVLVRSETQFLAQTFSLFLSLIFPNLGLFALWLI